MIDIIQAVNELKAKKIKQWPVRSNRASLMGHPCERYLVYKRTRWQEESMHDVRVQYIFDDGNVHETAVLRDLHDAGFQILEQQRAFQWKQYEITGSIDAKIVSNGTAIPIEIKSFSDWSWKAINSIEDMLKSKLVYMRGYPAQMTLYLLMDEKEEGAFILKNKSSGLLKQVNVKLDFEYSESLIQKAERINAHVKAETLPDRIPESVGACEWCSFSHICLPGKTHEASLLDDPEFEVKLNRRSELKPIKDEYDELDKEIRESVKEKPEVICGNWKLSGKWVEKNEYTVPASKYWQVSIKKIA